MNKKIRFILMILVAALFVFSARENYLFTSKVTYSSRITQVSIQNNLPFSPGVSREGRPQINKKIRIKAWDEPTAFTFATPIAVFYFYPAFAKVVYGGYRPYFECTAHIFSSSLRGPPVA